MKRLLTITAFILLSAPAFAADNDAYYVPPAQYYNTEQQASLSQPYASAANVQDYASHYYYAPHAQPQYPPQPQHPSATVAPLDTSGIMSSD